MKTIYSFFLPLLAILPATRPAAAAPEADTNAVERSLFERVTRLEKHLDFLSVDLNTRLAFHTALYGTQSDKSAFKADYLRLQLNARITDRITFRWYQHLNRSHAAGSVDNFPASIDCLGLGFQITPTLSTFIGKQYADFGGFEYDADPAEVYEYSDYGNYVTCFLLGANLVWQAAPCHELRFQVVDGRANTAAGTYGTLPTHFQGAKAPLGYTLNWNGRMARERLLTRCSFSLFHEGRKENVCFLSLGIAWVQERFNMYVDAMYSREGIDKLGILSEITANTPGGTPGPRATHARYCSVVSRINYRPHPKLNLFVKGAYETAATYKASTAMEKGKYRTSYTYQGGVEYFPTKENLRVFAVYRGRQVDFTTRAGMTGQHPQHLAFGVLYRIPVF